MPGFELINNAGQVYVETHPTLDDSGVPIRAEEVAYLKEMGELSDDATQLDGTFRVLRPLIWGLDGHDEVAMAQAHATLEELRQNQVDLLDEVTVAFGHPIGQHSSDPVWEVQYGRNGVSLAVYGPEATVPTERLVAVSEALTAALVQR